VTTRKSVAVAIARVQELQSELYFLDMITCDIERRRNDVKAKLEAWREMMKAKPEEKEK
jgi:hypothetical protein